MRADIYWNLRVGGCSIRAAEGPRKGRAARRRNQERQRILNRNKNYALYLFIN
jgi:hypothetical protein